MSESISVKTKKVAENSTAQSLKIHVRLKHLIASKDAKAGLELDIKYQLACSISVEKLTHSSASQLSQTKCKS